MGTYDRAKHHVRSHYAYLVRINWWYRGCNLCLTSELHNEERNNNMLMRNYMYFVWLDPFLWIGCSSHRVVICLQRNVNCQKKSPTLKIRRYHDLLKYLKQDMSIDCHPCWARHIPAICLQNLDVLLERHNLVSFLAWWCWSWSDLHPMQILQYHGWFWIRCSWGT